MQDAESGKVHLQFVDFEVGKVRLQFAPKTQQFI